MSIVSDFFKKHYEVEENRFHLTSGVEWLALAQDRSGDGGFSGWYSLLTGWAPTYIETTGYIITTFLDASIYLRNETLAKRAMKSADFLCTMQLKSGAFRRDTPKVFRNGKSIVFNTAQDVLGLVDIYNNTKDRKYLESAEKAGNWLVSIQEKDGSWIKNTYGNKTSTYDSRVAWALLALYRITNYGPYKKSAVMNLNWILKNQKDNGWFEKNSLPDQKSDIPYTHTISYAMEGLLWSGILLRDSRYITAAKLTADSVLAYYRENDFMPGRFNSEWKSSDRFSCLTGDAQMSIVWLKLFQLTGDEKYLNSARRINYYLKSTQDIHSKNKNVKGAIKGSDPIYGDPFKGSGYCRMAYVNWGTKFFIDALILEDLIVEKPANRETYFAFKI